MFIDCTPSKEESEEWDRYRTLSKEERDEYQKAFFRDFDMVKEGLDPWIRAAVRHTKKTEFEIFDQAIDETMTQEPQPKQVPKPETLDPETAIDANALLSNWRPSEQSVVERIHQAGQAMLASCERFKHSIADLGPHFQDLCVEIKAAGILGPRAMGASQLDREILYVRKVAANLQIGYPVEIIGGIEFLDPLGAETVWMECRLHDRDNPPRLFVINLADRLGVPNTRLVSRAYFCFFDDCTPEVYVEPEGCYVDRHVIDRPMLEAAPIVLDELMAAAVVFIGLVALRNEDIFRIAAAE